MGMSCKQKHASVENVESVDPTFSGHDVKAVHERQRCILESMFRGSVSVLFLFDPMERTTLRDHAGNGSCSNRLYSPMAPALPMLSIQLLHVQDEDEISVLSFVDAANHSDGGDHPRFVPCSGNVAEMGNPSSNYPSYKALAAGHRAAWQIVLRHWHCRQLSFFTRIAS